MKRVLNHAVNQEQQTQGFQVLQNSVGSAHRKIASGKKILKHWQNGQTKETKLAD